MGLCETDAFVLLVARAAKRLRRSLVFADGRACALVQRAGRTVQVKPWSGLVWHVVRERFALAAAFPAVESVTAGAAGDAAAIRSRCESKWASRPSIFRAMKVEASSSIFALRSRVISSWRSSIQCSENSSSASAGPAVTRKQIANTRRILRGTKMNMAVFIDQNRPGLNLSPLSREKMGAR